MIVFCGFDVVIACFVEESNDKIQIFQKLDWESNESSLVCAALRQRGNHHNKIRTQ